MAVHRLQPSLSGLQCSTARSPVLLHGPRLTGARTGTRFDLIVNYQMVIFPALDIRVKNVAGTYSLEHKGENDLFAHQTRLLLFQKNGGRDFYVIEIFLFGLVESHFQENLEQNDQMFRPSWKDIFRMNQSELEAEIRKGNSRGPLIDSYDHVIGVNTTTLTRKDLISSSTDF
ncbi:hypothetical protein Zm00014a_028080 [Zea mays]|uniref:Uncharacterized protein n=1 Tax=Zea mays TaxID=4577 RepID=A0A3L6ETC2_MAIZE|nr:hypothetical protein Zm00014a_028080 [Zea mays]